MEDFLKTSTKKKILKGDSTVYHGHGVRSASSYCKVKKGKNIIMVLELCSRLIFLSANYNLIIYT